MPTPRIPQLPPLLKSKIYKTGQTRGADDDVIYQNRVSRSSTVLIPYELWKNGYNPPDDEKTFENGFIVLIPPETYFDTNNFDRELQSQNLSLGKNALIFYETRIQWNDYKPKSTWTVPNSRQDPLGGQYVARIPATTSTNTERSGKIILGFNTTTLKGAGIRVYEYASSQTINICKFKLEMLYWHCHDADKIALENGMSTSEIATRQKYIMEECERNYLLNIERITKSRIINRKEHTICPLCLQEFSGRGFFSRVKQPEGREVPDLTVTQINLFHVEELKYGAYNHQAYNLGWGHHHCNVVVKDSGIKKTLDWMSEVLQTNIREGHFKPGNNSSC